MKAAGLFKYVWHFRYHQALNVRDNVNELYEQRKFSGILWNDSRYFVLNDRKSNWWFRT